MMFCTGVPRFRGRLYFRLELLLQDLRLFHYYFIFIPCTEIFI